MAEPNSSIAPGGTLRSRPGKRKAIDEVDAGGDGGDDNATMQAAPGIDEKTISLPTTIPVKTVRQFIWYTRTPGTASVGTYQNGHYIDYGWSILPTQILNYYVKPSDLHGMCALGSHVTIKKITSILSNISAVEDREVSTGGGTDLITTPSNQPFIMVYTDHDHDLPLLALQDGGVIFPPANRSVPARLQATLPYARALGPPQYFGEADADPMNTGKVEYHHCMSAPIVINHEPNKTVPVSVLTSDGSYLNIKPAMPDGPGKWNPCTALDGKTTISPCLNPTAGSGYGQGWAGENPINGVPSQEMPLVVTVNQAARDDATKTTGVAFAPGHALGISHDPSKNDADKYVLDFANTSTLSRNYYGYDVKAGAITGGVNIKSTSSIPTMKVSGPDDKPDNKESSMGSSASGPGVGAYPTEKIPWHQFVESKEGLGTMNQLHFGTRVPRMTSIPVTLLKTAPFQALNGKAHPYSLMFVCTMKAEFEVHRNRSRFDYVKRFSNDNGYDATGTFSGTNVHSNIEGMGTAYCFG